MKEASLPLVDVIINKVYNLRYIDKLSKVLKNNVNYIILFVCIIIICFAKSLIIYEVMFMCENDMVRLTGPVIDIDEILLSLGHQWDSVHFVNIASNWYPPGVEIDGLYAFAPLYPCMISIVGNYVENYYIAGILISNTFYFLSLVAFYFVSRQYMREPYTYLTTTAFATFPTYLVYGTVAYTEPIALFFAISSWFFFKKDYYLISSIFITFAIFTRYVFAFIVPLYGLIILSRSIRKFKRHDKRRSLINLRILWLLIPTISVFLLFKYFESLTGNFFIALDSHIFFADALKTPIAQFEWFFSGFYTNINRLNPLQLLLDRYIFTIPFIILTISLLRNNKELSLYGIVMILISMSTIGISGIAAPRIILCAWVALLGLGKDTPRSIYFVIIVTFIIMGLWTMFRFLTSFFA